MSSDLCQSLRTFPLIFSTHPYFAAYSHATSCIVRTLSKIKWTKTGQMAIAIALPGFNDLGRSVSVILRLVDHFPCRFFIFIEKIKKIYQLEVWILFWLFSPSSLTFRLSVQRLQMFLEGLRFVKALATFGIIYATDTLQQTMTEVICLRWLTIDILIYKPLQTCCNYVRQFFKIRVVFHTLYLWNEVGDPQFFCYFWHKQLIIWLR